MTGALPKQCAMALAAAAMVLLFQVSFMNLGLETLEDEALANGDGYTWLALIDGWRETGRWRPVVPAHNAPYGLETHLTLPFAAVVRGLAWPLHLNLAPAEAHRMAGKLSGPILHIASAIALAWAARALLGAGSALLVVVAFLVMPLAKWRFGVHEFDHHGLHLFLSALLVSLLLHHAIRQRGGFAAAAGAVAGVGVWAGVEMLIPAGTGGLALALVWATRGGQWRARGLWLYALGLAIALAAAVLVEHATGQRMSLALDRVSGTHVLLGVFLAGATRGIVWLQGRWPDIGAAGRMGAGALAAAGVWAATLATVPDFLLGPYGAPTPVVAELHQGVRSEQGVFAWFLSVPGFPGFHLCLAVIVVAAVFAGLRTSRRDAWAVLATGALVGAAAAIVQFRLIQHYEMFACVALGAGAAAAGRFVWQRAPVIVRLAAVPVVPVVLLSPVVGDVASRSAPVKVHPALESAYQDDECDWQALGRALARLPGKCPGIIATLAAPGPELAHFSGRGVIATGCHCNAEGMRDARAILLGTPTSARAVAERRHLGFVVQCSSARGWQGHEWYVERSGPEGVYGLLAREKPPEWLVRVPASELGLDGFLVWRTGFGGSENVCR